MNVKGDQLRILEDELKTYKLWLAMAREEESRLRLVLENLTLEISETINGMYRGFDPIEELRRVNEIVRSALIKKSE